jgi:hypothetical protein
VNRTAWFAGFSAAAVITALFAGRGEPAVQATSAAAVAVAPAGLGGCEREYGTSAHCVPSSYPPGVTDRCAWLRAHGYEPLQVIGPDRLGLDTNHNGVACDPGDH